MSFPEDFTWGVATSSYQIEGAAHTDGRGPSIWDTFSYTPGKVVGGEHGDIACDHYNRYPQDVALMKDLGVQAYRFSIAWPRLYPQGDARREQRGFDFYSRLIDELLNAGITPVPTLYHWDLPQATHDRGGWANRDIVAQFADYAGVIATEFGDRAKKIITLNEPWCFTWLGHMSGVHAPGMKDLDFSIATAHHSVLAHAEATRAMRAVHSDIESGITLNMTNFRVAEGSSPEVHELAALQDAHINRWWIESQLHGVYPQILVDHYGDKLARVIKDGDMDVAKIDSEFLGINYYSDSFLSNPAEGDKPAEDGGPFPFPQRASGQVPEPTTDMGWPITPDGLYDLLMRIERDWPEFQEISITENGAAYPEGIDADGEVHDERRVEYIRDHIAAVIRAAEDGSKIRSYFGWSFMDNFEWAEGYAKRFGLVHVDFDTQVRTPKDSAKAYAAIIASNGAVLASVGR
jgi:beta-glucosidase